MGRQYIGEIGKTDNGIITVTAHLYDGLKSLPSDIALYQKADYFTRRKKRPIGNEDFIIYTSQVT